MLGIAEYGAFCAAILVFLMLRGPGRFARDSQASHICVEPRQHGRQAFFITLSNPKAIVFHRACFPLFIHPASYRGAMTAACGLLLHAFAHAVGERVRPHRRRALSPGKGAGGFPVRLGIRLGAR